MGVVNITPDSFSDGGRFLAPDRAIAHARQLIADGADILDLGAESTRPGATPVPADEEIDRLRPVLAALAGNGVTLSVDTMKPDVADFALQHGAAIVNDVSGAADPRMLEVASRHGAALVLMHMRGTPRTMQHLTQYDDVVAEVRDVLAARVAAARAAGVREVIVDPGIGFAKTAAQSLELLRRLPELRVLGCPILAGPSRKSFLGKVSGVTDAPSRLPETIAAVCAAVINGADWVRVHDVAECRRALAVVDAIRGVSWTGS